ncbi:GNAT family N-acetyltransferase [Paenibacillus soyae]|uniref:GNAT family N-acetyltransferase n=1 Tax=Paenibacillus soyae TaxID=2969249 RepID=A0A9X2MLZ1_9BACL|nr:GNAT family N-acetyltransferase [Paenibacillus soyae]MCR2802785.1 GNAT family N-acetyltransferase [Paenibacillus soyae]
MNNEYQLTNRVPTIEEYVQLCTEVGWKDYMNFEAAEHSLPKSLFGVVAQHGDRVVGMGRVVGDGHIYFYIQDIAVSPDHQNKGIGQMIMEAITSHLKEHAPEKAFVGLFAAQGKEPFYQRYGFQRHDGMTGMFGVVHGNQIL